MLKEKKSFFERLAGSISVDDEDEPVDFEMQNEGEELPIKHSGSKRKDDTPTKHHTRTPHHTQDEDGDIDMEEGELSVDVYQTPTEIIIEAMVAGVKPEDLQIGRAHV